MSMEDEMEERGDEYVNGDSGEWVRDRKERALKTQLTYAKILRL